MFPKTHETASSKTPPPWQVLDLVAHHLDPQTLAAARCVSTAWSTAMSADHLWRPICAATYPFLSNLRRAGGGAAATPPPPFCKLYSLGRAAAKRRLRDPPKPRLSTSDFFFAVDVHNHRGAVAGAVVPGRRLNPDRNGIFRFDVDVAGGGDVAFDELDSLRITWNVVLEGYKGVFTMMDCWGKGSFVLGLEGWFSKELPSARCCSGGAASGLVADLRLGLRESGGRVVVEKMSVGVLSIVSWRYVCLDDALRYLQHFLLPCGV